MECSACYCVVGENYTLSGGHCGVCNYEPKHKYIGTYLGKRDSAHWFRIHHEVCPNCGFRMTRCVIPCSYPNGIDVTEEYKQLVYK